MKGPGLRTKLDTRRLWKCPETGRLLKMDGQVTQMLSPFSKKPGFMQLVEHIPAPRPQPSLEEILSHMQVPPAPPEAVEPAANAAQEPPAATEQTDS